MSAILQSGKGDVFGPSGGVIDGDLAVFQGTSGKLLRSAAGVTPPVIWSVRQRSYNAVGNPTFEIDQRITGGLLPVNGSIWPVDRWIATNNTGVTPLCGRLALPVKVPGTNFRITGNALTLDIKTASKPSLAAGDVFYAVQNIEGCCMRELIDDVHSISILAQTNVAGGLKFALSLRDSIATPTRSLVKLCTIPTANTWTLIQLPALPIWDAGAAWSTDQGTVGYVITIAAVCGTTYMAPANDVWRNGNFVGAIGMDNLLSKPANSNLLIAFVQHEPGAECSTFIDAPFADNYSKCLRYYCKSYDYSVATGNIGGNGRVSYVIPTSFPGNPVGCATFAVPMAKPPTLLCYSDGTGAVNAVRDQNSNVDRAVTTTASNSRQITQLGLSTSATVGGLCTFHYTADTGW